MKVAHDVNLLRLIKVIPPLLVVIFACIAIAFVFTNNHKKLEQDIASLQQDFIASRTALIQEQVSQIVQQIEYEKSNTESILKEDIKQHIYQAHAIATTIYQDNKDKPYEEVKALIKSALSNIRFNKGRGYFFIYATSGENIMHPILPHFEGKQKINLQDTRGNFIIRDMGSLAKKNKETYYTWWFVKPDNKEQEFRKIGFGKHFEPFDWFIGTGEYYIDVENDIQQKLVERISSIKYGDNGFVFLYNKDGEVLHHHSDLLKGRNILTHTNKEFAGIGKTVFAAANPEGSFVTYDSPMMPSSGLPSCKISYIQTISDWGWILGTGFYESEFESQLNNRKLDIEKQNQHQFLTLLGLSLLATLFFLSLSVFLARYLSKRFSAYEERINHDFDELNAIKLESQYQAVHDALTQLPNRVLLQEHINSGIKASAQSNSLLAVMFLDLDDFKKINDLHGHSIGDALLKKLGILLPTVIGEKDLVARFGGDEFIFCFPEMKSLEVAEHKAKQILSLFERVFDIRGKEIYSSASIGISVFPTDGNDAESLVSKADTALYKSKSQQKGLALFFNEHIDQQVKREFIIETELRNALDKQEISVFYQPQICLQTGKITSVEALVRWHSDSLGFVSPAEFIPIAENTGEIHKLGDFVLKQTLLDITQFNDKRQYPIEVSVNISPKQLLDPFFGQRILKICETENFKTEHITLEITENVLISDLSQVRPVLEHLKAAGFKLSLDDFGTGYSSLSYLSNLPMDEIKIDRSFIDVFLTNQQSESLVKTIIAIGQFCNLKVVAEGVETIEQLNMLKTYNCDLVQGYYFDKPLPLTSLVERYKDK